MANLEKFKEQARKFELKEQWAKAIEPLAKAIEEFEKSPEEDSEIALYNRVGDLYVKLSDTTNAIQYYERAVDKFHDAGQVNPAIAVCNKVLRLSPGRSSVYLKLGMLFAKKGFAGEAKQNLLEYAGRMQKAGQIEEAFKALKKFAEMTPGQDEIWKVLAQQARAQATTPEAKEQVDKLLDEFEAKDRAQAQRKSRMSRSMITGEEIEEAPGPKKGELIFLDLGEAPAAPRAAPRVEAPAPEPEPERETVQPLEIESTAIAEEAPQAPAKLPMLEVEPTVVEGAESAAGAGLAIEPTSLGIEPTSLAGGPPALEIERTALGEPEPAPVEPEAAVPAAPAAEEFGAIELEPLEMEPAPASAEAAMAEAPGAEAPGEAPTAGLPLLEAEPAEPSEAAVAQSLEFMDLGEVVPEAPAAADLESRLAADGTDWEAHRLLGEVLLEQGERERGMAELEASLEGYEGSEQYDQALALCEEVIRLEPNNVRYQQKRVEVAYKSGDRPRLVDAYVELADALLRSDEPDKAVAVYQRVLEHDPGNVRAKTALETLAPPAPAVPEPEPAAAAAVPSAPSEEYVDLAAMLLEEESPKDTRMRIEDEEPTGDEQKDFQQMLAAFKKGIETAVEETDFQSHYDLGVAFKEMGLLDEAIAEFQKALRSSDGRLKSSEALGVCFYEKGQFAVAETILKRGLDLPASGDAERIGLLYWLGRTLEDQGKPHDALQVYNRVFAVDINFQDVNQRVQALARAGA